MMRRAEVMARVAEVAGCESTFVYSVMQAACDEIVKEIVRGRESRFDAFGIFSLGRRNGRYLRVVVAGGGRERRWFPGSVVPSFRPVVGRR